MGDLYTAFTAGMSTAPPPVRFFLWVPEEHALKFHRIAPVRSTEARHTIETALAWLADAGQHDGVVFRDLFVDTSERIQAIVDRAHARGARRLFDVASDRFGLHWFDPERDETTLGMRFGDVHEISEAIEAVARGGEGWLLLETADGRGPFVELGLEPGHTRAHSEAPTEIELGVSLDRASRAQLKLLGWCPTERSGYRAELGLSNTEERRRAAQVVSRTLQTVYGVSPGEPMALRFRAEDPGLDAA